MINRDPRCVFVADSLELAEVVALWLKDQGIPAQPMDTTTLGGLDGLTWMSKTGTAARGIEVWVVQPDDSERAASLLEEHHTELAARPNSPKADGAPIEVDCEECGQQNSFPSSQSGKVENCKGCGAYLDVPSDEEEWEEGEAEPEES